MKFSRKFASVYLFISVCGMAVDTFASTCTVDCQRSWSGVADTRWCDNSQKKADFWANCREFYSGSPSCESNGLCECAFTKTQYASGASSGADISIARENARYNCKENLSYSPEPDAGISYSNYSCQK